MTTALVFDVVEDILLRLDTEDLLRCKSVCKSWYSLISSPSFVKAHLKHACNNNRELPHLRVCLPYKNINYTLRLYRMVGSSNGLVCLSPSNAEFLVTNPSTREVIELRALPCENRSDLCWGFGYDSSTDDYKLVVGVNEGLHHIRFQVLTLKSNVWKFTEELNYNFHVQFGSGFGLLYNGALHWFMDDPNNNMKRVIIYFDLSSEKFKEIPQPDDTNYVCDIFSELGIFDECLCVYRPVNGIPIWAMKNYNVKQSWQLLPYDDAMKDYIASFTAYTLDCISYNGWRFSDDKGNIAMSCCWMHISDPVFVKSLVSPYGYEKPKKTKYKRSLKVDSSYTVISSSFFFKHTMSNNKRKKSQKNYKRNINDMLFQESLRIEEDIFNNQERKNQE
ncbi:putative F-box domain-containing protein [Tanacetum coccineum]|uniref:F-box domain-containing protein n=1 Tax=Tanacetum coccineum TaxID=301880 RepID=A0ABQ5FXG5_9ASTR